MATSVALRRPSFSPTWVAMLAALFLAFAFGGASGYLVKALNTPAPTTIRVTAACPAGTHVAVWYTARTWGCVNDPTGR